jgi:hypothetical protein
MKMYTIMPSKAVNKDEDYNKGSILSIQESSYYLSN